MKKDEKSAGNPTKGLKGEAKAFFLQLRSEYAIEDPGGLYSLKMAAAAYQTFLSQDKIIKDQGSSLVDRFGQAKENPACSIQTRASAEMRNWLKTLGLDLEPVRPGPGRPGGGIN
jgi:phage terminase small subunit